MNNIIAEGKTKMILNNGSLESVDLVAKEDITAGDGKKHDLMQGKPELATRTTCNIFRLFQRSGIPVSFQKQVDARTFRALHCNMIPYEVVVRLEADGSALERDTGLKKYDLFVPPRVEFYLKTSGKMWRGVSIPVDDPYIKFETKQLLYDPHNPLDSQTPFLIIADDFSSPKQRQTISRIAREAALVLRDAWENAKGRLIDIKFEFGTTRITNELVLSDVVDNDSWRVVYGGEDVSKQGYRDGQSLPTVKGKYELVAQLTDGF